MASNEKTLKEILSNFVQSKPIKNKYNLVHIKEVWRTQLGPSIQHYTTDLTFSRDVLTVRLTSAPLRQELLYNKPKLIKLLNDALGEQVIKDVKIF